MCRPAGDDHGTEFDVVPPAIEARPVSSAWGVSVLVQRAHGRTKCVGGRVDRGQGIVRELPPEAAGGVPVADQVAEQLRCAVEVRGCRG